MSSKNFVSFILHHLESLKNITAKKNWMIVEYSELGFIGKLFRNRDLPLFILAFLKFSQNKPIDFLHDHILKGFSCPASIQTDKEWVKKFFTKIVQRIGQYD